MSLLDENIELQINDKSNDNVMLKDFGLQVLETNSSLNILLMNSNYKI